MKRFRSFNLILSILTLTSLLASPVFTYAQVVLYTLPSEAPQEPSEVVVKYKGIEDVSVIEVPDATTIEEVIDSIEVNPNVEYAEPNFARNLFTLDTDDTFANLLWGHDNIGQTVSGFTGTNDADMDIAEAWQISTGTQAVLVGVIDTGVLYTHPDLSNSMWTGSGCLNESGTTTTCTHGYDFYNNDSDPLPDSNQDGSSAFHGTHIAGTIGAEVNNGRGIAGVAPQAKIVALRFGFDVESEVRAIDFAIANGIKVINASYGGGEFSQLEYDAIKRFRDAGGIFVAAAGNSSRNNDGGTHNYPSDYDLDNIISVGATDQNDVLTTFSNWGTSSVDVAAPGKNILSTYLNNQYAYADGTSMATAYVTGVVALLWSVEPTLTATQVRDRIILTGDSLPSLSGKTVSGKRVNAYNAISATTTVPTAILSNTPASQDISGSIDITVSGENASQYKYKLDDASWSSALSISTHITSSDLSNATHTVSVIAGSPLNIWQSEASSTNYVWLVDVPPPVPPTPVPSSGGGGGGGGGVGGGGGGGGGSTTVALSPILTSGDLNGDSRVDLLDFNSLMITWSGRTNAFVDFNNLMINWTR